MRKTQITRRGFIGTLGAGAMSLGLHGVLEACKALNPPEKRPNVLTIQPDQHRGTIMRCS